MNTTITREYQGYSIEVRAGLHGRIYIDLVDKETGELFKDYLLDLEERQLFEHDNTMHELNLVEF